MILEPLVRFATAERRWQTCFAALPLIALSRDPRDWRRRDVRVQTSALRPIAVPRWRGWGYIREINLEVSMLLALAVILLILAVVGGIAIHPLLFLIALLAVLALVASRSGRF
jgi:hypothetical protein